jgi:hypothetical protein
MLKVLPTLGLPAGFFSASFESPSLILSDNGKAFAGSWNSTRLAADGAQDERNARTEMDFRRMSIITENDSFH